MNNLKALSFIFKYKSVSKVLLFAVLWMFLFSCGKNSKEEVAPGPTAPTSLSEGDVYYSNGKDGYVLHDPDGTPQVFKIASFGNVVKDIAIDDKNNKVCWLVGDSTVVVTGPDGSVKNTWKKNIIMTDMDCVQGGLYVSNKTNDRIVNMNSDNGSLGVTAFQGNTFGYFFSFSASRYAGVAPILYMGRSGNDIVNVGIYYYYTVLNETKKLDSWVPYAISVTPGNVAPFKGCYFSISSGIVKTLYESGLTLNDWAPKVLTSNLLSTRFEVDYKKNIVYYADKDTKKLAKKDLSNNILPSKPFNVDVSAEFAVDVVNL